MRRIRRPGRPRVFLSFAGPDQKTADRLRHDLTERDIATFSFTPGKDLVQDIDRALTQSDYFVLLWSRSAVDRPWVNAEVSAAFVRALQTQRSFFFIVRLDTTPLPTLLAPRHYLDAFDNWTETVNELVATWRRDQAVGGPVLPAPCSATTHRSATTSHGAAQCPTIVLYVRNRQLSVAHVIVVPAAATGQELESLVRAQLALPDVETSVNGAVGTRFDYQLKNAGRQIPADDTPLAQLSITDGAVIDLEVQVQWVGPTGPSPTVTYRRGPSPGRSPDLKQFPAFDHLIP